MKRGWGEGIDRRLATAVAQVVAARPGQVVRVRPVLDDRGVVAMIVTAGDGRLVTAARSVDLVRVGWPWPDGVASAFGVWPVHEIPTVAELLAGLVVAV